MKKPELIIDGIIIDHNKDSLAIDLRSTGDLIVRGIGDTIYEFHNVKGVIAQGPTFGICHHTKDIAKDSILCIAPQPWARIEVRTRDADRPGIIVIQMRE
jgi:hypothetical protein